MSESTQKSETTQKLVGPYRLLNLLRTGKTCQIWEVMDDMRQQKLAIKLLLVEYCKNREEIGYLRHEHEVGRKLEHPNVLRAYGFGNEGENVYLAMEMFQALNLKQILFQTPDELAVLLPKVVDQAGRGLQYLHEQDWIHRDIKPDNYLMKPTGEVKLIDFALAERKKGALARLFGGRTKIQGTRSYMSPEQIRGKPLDQRADIYSFGCMVHELFSGRPPFTGSSTNELLNKHIKTPPPTMLAANRNVTQEFADLVRRLMAKSPDDRPASVDEFLQELYSIEVYKDPPTKRANP